MKSRAANPLQRPGSGANTFSPRRPLYCFLYHTMLARCRFYGVSGRNAAGNSSCRSAARVRVVTTICSVLSGCCSMMYTSFCRASFGPVAVLSGFASRRISTRICSAGLLEMSMPNDWFFVMPSACRSGPRMTIGDADILRQLVERRFQRVAGKLQRSRLCQPLLHTTRLGSSGFRRRRGRFSGRGAPRRLCQRQLGRQQQIVPGGSRQVTSQHRMVRFETTPRVRRQLADHLR